VEERLEALHEPWTSYLIEFPTYPKLLSHGREESQRVLFLCPQAESNPTELCLALFGSQILMHRLNHGEPAPELSAARFILVYATELPRDLRHIIGRYQEQTGAPVLVAQKSSVVKTAQYVNELLRRAIVAPEVPGPDWTEMPPPAYPGGPVGPGLQSPTTDAEIWRDPLPEIGLVDEDGNRIGANTDLQDYRVEYACRYVLAHFKENINRDKMAEMVGLSPGYFSNLFRGEVGMSFSDYLIQVRIENAKSLLRRFDLSVEAISRQCGFNSLAHFSRTFKDRVGLSPLKYRKSPGSGQT
jgi:AraC-like DNA-binding protein